MLAQIKYNYERKFTDGVSNWFGVFTLVSYAMWVLHGWQVHDMSLVYGQGLGVIVTGLIFWQVVIYRKHQLKTSSAKPPTLWYLAIITGITRHSLRNRLTTTKPPRAIKNQAPYDL